MTAPTVSSPPPPAADPTALRALRQTVLVIAALCGLAVLLLLVQHLRSQADDPLKSPQLLALKQQLLAEPKNEALKQQIRLLDLDLRRSHVRDVAFNAFGAWFVLVGVVVLVFAAKGIARFRVVLPSPHASPDAAERVAVTALRARRVTVGVAAITGVAFLVLALPAKTRLPSSPAGVDKVLAKLRGEGEDAPPLPSPAEFAANWPRFLGPSGAAFVTNAAFPLAFNLASGEGVLWRTPVPAPGFNSPLIWSNRVFLSGGDATNRSVFAFDLTTGTQVWQRAVANVPGSPAKPPEVPDSTGFAASTMATDGRRVFAMFANGDLATFNLDGSPVWSKNLGVPKNQYGFATSLAIWQGRLSLPYDQGEPENNLSKLIAFDGATGRVIWQKPRPVGQSWATPVVYEVAGKPQIATLAGELVIAYSVADGNELWRAQMLSGEITPSPIFAGGLVVAISPSDQLFAIKPDGAGDVTKSHVVWKTDENVPDVTSPVSNGELVFAVTSSGTVTCFDLKDGKKLWEHECELEVSSSPAIAGDRVYVFGTKGGMAVLAAAREARELAKADLAEGVLASPAFARGVMVVRTVKTLFCVADKGGPVLEAKRP